MVLSLTSPNDTAVKGKHQYNMMHLPCIFRWHVIFMTKNKMATYSMTFFQQCLSPCSSIILRLKKGLLKNYHGYHGCLCDHLSP